MKIRIAFSDGEEAAATTAITALLDSLTGVRIHKSEAKSPYNIVYLSTKKLRKPRNSGEST